MRETDMPTYPTIEEHIPPTPEKINKKLQPKELKTRKEKITAANHLLFDTLCDKQNMTPNIIATLCKSFTAFAGMMKGIDTSNPKTLVDNFLANLDLKDKNS